MKNNELSGIIVPVITPVDDQDRVDEKAFRKVIRYVIKAGVDGIFVGGSAGEGPLLAEKEWARMVEIAFDEKREEVHLFGGVSDTSSKKVLTKIKRLAKIGYKNFVATPTFYLPIKTAEEQLRLFGECRESGGNMEMIAYNIPQFTGSEISVATMCEMARRGWIKYCKESSGNLDYFCRLVTEGKQVGLKVFLGEERFIVYGLFLSICGIVPVCANYEPQTYIRAYQAAISQNLDEMIRMQKRIMFLRERLVSGMTCWIAGVKYAMATLDMGSGKPVSPLQPLNADEKKIIDGILNKNIQGKI